MREGAEGKGAQVPSRCEDEGAGVSQPFQRMLLCIFVAALHCAELEKHCNFVINSTSPSLSMCCVNVKSVFNSLSGRAGLRS